jgi:hypothetical protein
MTSEEIKEKALEVAKAKAAILGDGELDVYGDEGDIDIDTEGGARVTASIWVSNAELGISDDFGVPADLADDA